MDLGPGGGVIAWGASGLVYGEFLSAEGDLKSYRLFLVTNRHVFDGASAVVLRFNPEGTDPAREFDVALNDASGHPLWIAHPDPAIDVAVLGLNAGALEAEKVQFSYFRSDQHVLNKTVASDAGISEGDGVYVLGFPLGLVGAGRNYAIIRQGAIARIRDWLAGSASEILIDVSVFPGNSGGPVVTRPEMVSISGTKSQNAANLIGIVKGYVPYEDVAISTQTGRPRVTFEENSGLASVVPIDFVQEVIKLQIAKTGAVTPTQEPAVPPEQPPASAQDDKKQTTIRRPRGARYPARTTEAAPGPRRSLAEVGPATPRSTGKAC